MFRIQFVSAAIVLLGISIARGEVRRVPSEFPNIQAAVDASVDGDIVLVADGVYVTEHARFYGKGITVKSENGPDRCIIDCDGTSRAFTFLVGDESDAVVEGFTIRRAYNVAAIWCHGGSSPTIRRCKITQSVTDGISIDDSSPLIEDCEFSWNAERGIRSEGGSPVIRRCKFFGHINGNNSGGLYFSGSGSPRIENCTISQSAASGAVVASGSSATFVNCLFSRNRTSLRGGGVYVSSGVPVKIVNCTFQGNSATMSGSAVAGQPMTQLTNCLVWDDESASQISNIGSGGPPEVNYSNVRGGYAGIANFNVDPTFAFDNRADVLVGSPCVDSGAALGALDVPPFDLYGNPRPADGDGDGVPEFDVGAFESAGSVPQIGLSADVAELHWYGGKDLSVTEIVEWRNVGGGALIGQVVVSPQCSWLNAAPSLWISTGGLVPIQFSIDPAEDVPTQQCCPVHIIDFTNPLNSRALEVCVYSNSVLRVPAEYPTIQSAIDAAALPGDTILLSDGTYSGAGNCNLNFAGKPLILRSENGLDETAIDCNYGSRVLAFSFGEPPSTLIEGITIERGLAGNAGGGAVSIVNSSPTFRNVRFRKCRTSYDGGAVAVQDASPLFDACRFEENFATSDGGAVYVREARPKFLNCVFRGNEATRGGGAYVDFSGNPTFTNCTIVDNLGSAIGCTSGGVPVVTNSVIWGNSPMQLSCSTFSNPPIVTYTNIQNGWTGIGNFGQAPSFALSQDFHLRPGSICIDHGTLFPPGGLPEFDAEGLPRILNGYATPIALPDMGAYEYNPSAQCLAVSPEDVTLAGAPGVVGIEPGHFEIRSCGAGFLDWYVEFEEPCPWLTVEPNYGTSIGEIDVVTIQPDVSKLSHGQYECRLRIIGTGAFNSLRHVDVTANVPGELFVPAEYSTIQEAVDAAVAGDVITLAEGTYVGEGNRNVDFKGKAIAIRGANGPANTVIDCQHLGRGFRSSAYEGPGGLLEDVTIINGMPSTPSVGGGVLIQGAAPFTIRNCVIRNCSAAYGGGVSSAGEALIDRCIIASNTANEFGGGVSANWNTTIVDSVIELNTAFDGGGGVYAGNATIRGSIIRNNQSYGSDYYIYGGGGVNVSGVANIHQCLIENNTSTRGGGIYNAEAHMYVYDSLIIGNSTPGFGGGIFSPSSEDFAIERSIVSGNSALAGGGIAITSSGSDVGIRDTQIINNHASNWGGGLMSSGNWFSLTNCLIAENTSDYGGGLVDDSSFLMLDGCTISNNGAEEGGGIRIGGGYWGQYEVTVANSILWSNSANVGSEVYLDGWSFEISPALMTASYSDFSLGTGDVFFGPGAMLDSGAGMISTEPRFMEGLGGLYYLSQVAAGGNEQSPCVDSAAAGTIVRGTTRVDQLKDSQPTDMGFHYRIPGDFDGNYYLSLADWTKVLECLQGPNYARLFRCFIADANNDETVDLRDVAIMQFAFTGS